MSTAYTIAKLAKALEYVDQAALHEGRKNHPDRTERMEELLQVRWRIAAAITNEHFFEPEED